VNHLVLFRRRVWSCQLSSVIAVRLRRVNSAWGFLTTLYNGAVSGSTTWRHRLWSRYQREFIYHYYVESVTVLQRWVISLTPR